LFEKAKGKRRKVKGKRQKAKGERHRETIAEDECSCKSDDAFRLVDLKKNIKLSGMALANLGVTIGRRADHDTPLREKRI
jgi:hypothetical protein